MSDQYMLSDQHNLANLIPPDKEQELGLINQSCTEFCSFFNSRFNSAITNQEGFLLKLLGDYSGLDSRISDFWKDSPIFDCIKPVSHLNLSTKAFLYIKSLKGNQMLSMHYYLIDMLKGRYTPIKTDEGEYYHLIKPMYSDNSELFSIIVKLKTPDSNFIILVEKFESGDIGECVSLAIKEFCLRGEELAIVPTNQFKINQATNNSSTKIEEVKTKIEEVKTKIEEVNTKILDTKLKVIVKLKREKSVINSRSPSRNNNGNHKNSLSCSPTKRNRISIDSETVRKRFGNPYFKNSKEIRHYIDSSLIHELSETIESKLSLNLLKLKSQITQNRNIYNTSLNLLRDDIDDWVNLILYFLEERQKKTVLLDIFSRLNLIWSIFIEPIILKTFKEIKRQEFLQYLDKIISFAQGNLIDNLGKFHKLNDRKNENFLVVPVKLGKKTNLKPIFAVLCIFKSKLTNLNENQLKLLDFYDPKDFEKMKEDFRKSEKYLKIEKNFSLFKSNGLRDLVSIEEKKIKPNIRACQSQIKIPIKKIFILCIFPENSASMKFYIEINKEQSIAEVSKKIPKHLPVMRPIMAMNKERFLGEMSKIKKTSDGLYEHLGKFNAIFNSENRYKLILEIRANQWRNEYFHDDKKRCINDLEYEFLFNVRFINNLIDSNWIKNTKSLDSYYYQLQLYLDYCFENNEINLLDCLIQSFSNMKLNKNFTNSQKENQQNIVSFVESKYFRIIDEDNVEGLYSGLCILGLVENFLVISNTLSVYSLIRVLKIIEKHSDNYFHIFKINKNLKVAMKGLAMVLSLVKIKKNIIIEYCNFESDNYAVQIRSIDTYFGSIKDNEAQETVILNFLDMVKEIQDYFSAEEVDLIMKRIEFFENKKHAINLIIQNKIPIRKFLELLLQNDKSKEKLEIFNKALKSSKHSIKDLLSILKFLKDNEKVFSQKLFSKSDILKILKKHLNDQNNFDETDFSEIKEILILIKAQDYLSNFDIFNFLKAQVSNFGIDKCIILLLAVPDCVPKLIDSITNCGYITTNEYMNNLVTLLSKFPEKIQESASLYVFEMTSGINLKYQINNVANVESKAIKKSYKKIYRKKFLDESNQNLYKETMNYIQEKIKTNYNHIFFELITGAPLLFDTSYEELIQALIFKPDLNEFMFKFFEKNHENCNHRHYENILNFLSKMTNDISSRKITINDFELILNHNKQERFTFFKYFEYYFKDYKRFKKFYDDIFVIENQVRIKLSQLKRVRKIIYSPLSIFPEVQSVLETYNQFIETKRQLSLENFKLPDKISMFSNLNKFPLKSLICINCLFRKVDESVKKGINFMEELNMCYEILENFLKGLTKLEDIKTSIGNIEIFFACIGSISLFDKEIRALTEGFSTIFSENPNLTKNLLYIFQNFYEYRDCYELICSFGPSLKVLEISEQYISNFLLSSSDIYNSELLKKLKKFKEDFVRGFDQRDLKSLTLFFKQITKSTELVILMSNIKEYEFSMWNEFFYENLHDIETEKKLNTLSIKNFSIIWTFFNKVKYFKNDFASSLKNILDLMKEAEYSCITEIINYCNPKIEALEDFNSSLNTQEHLSLYKIKMIHKKSHIVVKREKKFLPEITLDSAASENISGTINLNDLAELRDRALLSKNIIEKRKDSSKLDISKELIVYDKFLKFENTLTRYISVLNELEDSLFKQSLEKEYEFEIENGNFKSLEEEFETKETGIYEKWNHYYKKATEQYYTINILNGEMISLIDEFLYDGSQENLNKILWVLKCIHKQPPYALGIKVCPPDDISERLENINKFFHFLKDSELSFNFPIEVINRKKEENSILLSETEEFYRSVLSIYAIYQSSLPYPELVIFCHYSTPWGEINRFLNRCALNPKKQIHTIVYPENLPLEIQKKIYSKLNSYYREKKSYSLAIVTKDPKSILVSNLVSDPLLKIENIDSIMLTYEQISIIMKAIAPNFIVITSECVGLGKSEFINQAAKSKGLPLVNINISATYDNLSLLSKIKNTIVTTPALYKFNLNFLSDPEYFHELIFVLTVFKMAFSEKSIFMIPDESFTYIEVANSFKNKLYNSLPFLKFLLTEEIKEFNLMNLIISDKLMYVCNYLHLLETGDINNKDLKFAVDSKKALFNDKNIYSNLLKKYFLANCGNSPNYHQLGSFVQVLSKLFQLIETSIFTAEAINNFKNDGLAQNLVFYSNLRDCMIKNIITTSAEFTTRCIDSTKSEQNQMENLLEEDSTEIEEFSRIANTIKWKDSNHFIMIFSKEQFIAIYRLPSSVPQEFKNFIVSQSTIYKICKGEKLKADHNLKGNGDLEDYNNYSSSELILKLLDFFYESHFKTENSNESKAEIVDKYFNEAQNTGYVLTPDNFLKMNLIYMRCISNLPLIIMGETGCGKTALLRFFVENILREKLMIVYVHSEIKVSDIEKILKTANQAAKELKNQRVWVFFDEFNTSDCIGEITSIFCERKFEDLELHSNLVFVGACNPYRVKSGRNYKENVGIKKKINNTTKLQAVHIVKPLSDKAFEFIWDFGSLDHDEIKVYVNSMLKRVNIKKVEFFTELICKAHQYFRDNEDCSSVSLRDVNRFTILYEWFSDSIENRKSREIKKPLREYTEFMQSIEMTDYDDEILPGILSFIHCYFLRIGSESKRNELLQFVLPESSQSDVNLTTELVYNIIKFQELDLISRMTLPKELAFNQALMENIFAIIPCILSKIPIFICGKPGCSKSLAVNIVLSNLKGDRSEDEYFKILPEALFFTIQGSDSCTSYEIEEVFAKAEKLLDENNNKLPIVLFDEIGLAESSKSNPLKVLHKLLENENCKVGFVAISNWRLDASKMNRALYLARPDPEESDLMKTAETLFSSYRKINDFEQYLPTIQEIAKGYYKMKQEYSQTDFPDFFGLRDFYQAIKYIAKNMEANSNIKLDIIVKDSLYRNFDGLPNSIEDLPLYYPMLVSIDRYHKDPISLIKSNLKDPESRYLMIISEQDISEFIISELLSNDFGDHRFILGSTFEKDIVQEESKFKILSDIIGYMEQGISIIMQNMDMVYSSLYDLFNQNFTYKGRNRKYCSAVIGSRYNPNCLVHNKFKVVVFLDNKNTTLKSVEAPFLNRFEKHNIELNDIIKEDKIKELSKTICDWVDQIVTIPSQKNRLSVTSVFPIFSPDIISLYIKYFKDSQGNKCKEFLLDNASTDVALLCQINGMSDKEKKNIVNEWKKLHSKSIEEYFKELTDKNKYSENEERVKMISVTYDSSEIRFNNIEKKIQKVKCCTFKCENEFRNNYERFLQSKEKKLYLFELEYSKESHHLRFIISLIDSIDKNFQVKKKNLVKDVCIIVKQKRSDEQRKSLLLFKGWKYKMFESFTETSTKTIEDLLDKGLNLLASEEKNFNFKQNIKEIAEKSLETLALKTDLFKYNDLIKFKIRIVEYIINNETILNKFKEKIFESFKLLDEKFKLKWFNELFTNDRLIYYADSIKGAQRVLFYNNVLSEFTNIICVCESKSGLSSLLATKDSRKVLDLWIDIFQRIETKKSIFNNKPESNKSNYFGQFKSPYFNEVYKMLKKNYEELIKPDYANNIKVDNELFDLYNKESIWKEKSSIIFEVNQIENLFLEDFIELTLIEYSFKKRYTEYIFYFVKNNYLSFRKESKLKALFDIKPKIIALNSLFLIYKKYSQGEDMRWITSQLTLNNPFDQTFKSVLENIILKFTDAKSHLDNLEIYNRDICQAKGYIQCINHTLILDNYELLEFLVQLSQLKKIELFKSIFSEEIVKSFNNLFKIDNIKRIIQDISLQVNLDKDLTFMFNAYFLNKALQRNGEIATLVVKQINETELWKYSGNLIEQIIDSSDLKSKIELIETKFEDLSTIYFNMNRLLEIISEEIKKSDIKNIFCSLFLDKIKCIKNQKTNPKKYGDVCKIYMDYVESNNSGDKLIFLIAIGRIQHYLNRFVELINPKNTDLKLNDWDIVNSMTLELKNRNLLVFELYCLKLLKGFNDVSISNLVEYFGKTVYKWKINYNEIQVQTKLLVFPIDEDTAKSDIYNQLKAYIIKIPHDIHALDRLIFTDHSNTRILELGMVFINFVYLMNSKDGFNAEAYAEWYNQKEKKIGEKFGLEFKLFLKLLIQNIPENGLFYLKPSTQKKSVNIAMLISYITLITISYSNNSNQFSSQFFKPKSEKFPSLFERSKQIYYVGAEIPLIQNFLITTRDKFEVEKN